VQIPKSQKKSPNTASEDLVKHALARRLKEEIVTGALKPGVRIVEGVWGRKLGVAQGSIREAINILAQEGFITKTSGRSARVLNLSEQDVLDLYELRGALEGLAARLAVARRVDPKKLEDSVAAMRRASKERRLEDLLDADQKFHMELCELSGNPHVVDHARRVLLPFFAFVRIRVITSGQTTEAWDRDLEAHQRVVDLIREGEGDVAELYVRRIMARFGTMAYQNWEKKTPPRSRRKGVAEAAED
jgi:DNA-binding GntR family transcriptional regulator